MAKPKKEAVASTSPIKLDLGCGPSKKGPEWVGIDQYQFSGVDHVLTLGSDPLPYGEGTVEEMHSSHFLEHLGAEARCHVINEAYRVLKPGGQFHVVVPHWRSSRAYGDPTHVWPPMGEMWFYYLDKSWRMSQAPHTDKSNWAHGYNCDFLATWGYSLNPSITTRNQEFQQFAVSHYSEAIMDIIATLTKR